MWTNGKSQKFQYISFRIYSSQGYNFFDPISLKRYFDMFESQHEQYETWK